MKILNGLHTFIADDPEFAPLAAELRDLHALHVNGVLDKDDYAASKKVVFISWL